MKKWKIKRFFRNLCGKIRILFIQPHSITAFLLIIISVISLYFSYKTSGTFLSSVLSNVFAGLITGVAICFISGIKAYAYNSLENKIEWLERLHNECLNFLQMHKNLIAKKNCESLDNDLYDLICAAGGINTTISQSQFNKTLSFNLIKYTKNELCYDVDKTNENYSDVRDKILNNNNSSMVLKDIINLFSDVSNSVSCLNGAIVNKLTELKTKKSNLGKSII